MLTDKQNDLIRRAVNLGHPYSEFAGNISRQGWCSVRQECALVNMLARAAVKSRSRHYNDANEYGAGSLLGPEVQGMPGEWV